MQNKGELAQKRNGMFLQEDRSKSKGLRVRETLVLPEAQTVRREEQRETMFPERTAGTGRGGLGHAVTVQHSQVLQSPGEATLAS